MNNTSIGRSLGPLPFNPSSDDEESLAAEPSDLLKTLDAMPIELAASWMLTWYRNEDLWRVALSSHFFAQVRYQSWIDRMLGELQRGVEWQAASAIDLLAKYGEPALERILLLLDQPAIRPAVVEVIARMDPHVLPKVLRALDAEPWEIRLDFVRVYAKRNPETAYNVMAELLCDTGTNGSYWNDPMDPFPSLPPDGHREATNNRDTSPLQVVPLAGGSQ